jgi:YegS/Rv2252/BmrU family lipid kinase
VSRRFALLVNPAAAGGRALVALGAVRGVLDAAGAEHRVARTESLEHACTLCADAREAGEAVVAIGGDGLVGCLAGALRDAPVPLGIVPGGRGNDYARVLGIPFEAEAAARVLLDGREREVDVAEANGRPFVGIASLGFDSDANRIANETKRIRGNLVYLYAALRALAAWRHATFTVTLDGEAHSCHGFSVAVGNSKAYGGGMFLLPEAELDDGELDVFMSGAASKLRFLRDLPKVFAGTHGESPTVRFLRGREARVEADRPFVVYADGDPIAELPLTVTVRPRCLRVLVPAS